MTLFPAEVFNEVRPRPKQPDEDLLFPRVGQVDLVGLKPAAQRYSLGQGEKN
jgi:hypothetical protein